LRVRLWEEEMKVREWESAQLGEEERRDEGGRRVNREVERTCDCKKEGRDGEGKEGAQCQLTLSFGLSLSPRFNPIPSTLRKRDSPMYH